MNFDVKVYLYKPASGTLVQKRASRQVGTTYTLEEMADSLEGWCTTQAKACGVLTMNDDHFAIVRLMEPEEIEG